jgi:DtxR family Mn-dependent transcriptional regulator
MVKNDELISESMEMYLVTIVRLREDSRQPVPLSQLAEALSVTPVSVNEMCRKLQEGGYLVYRPYKGAMLTENGEKLANHVLRRHRLWEVFLIEKLHLDYPQANEAACELEHVVSDEVIDKLDEFLGFPKVDPRGLPIPASKGNQWRPRIEVLSKMSAGWRGHIVHCDVSEKTQVFLAQQGIRPGIIISVLASGGNNLLVKVNNGQVSLSSDIAEKVTVTLTNSDEIIKQEGELLTEEPDKKGKEAYLQMETDKGLQVEKIHLSELKKGQHGIIVQVGGEGAVKRRMMDMGVVPGSEISVVRVAPFGDPIEFNIKGYSLSLRRSEAKKIMVERVDRE